MHRYVGGFIGTEEKKDEWLTPKIQEWVAEVKILAKAAKRYQQTAYSGLVRSLQTEWTYLQRVVPDLVDFFARVERALLEDFLPALFAETDANALRELACFPVRFGGLGIPDPAASAAATFGTSVQMTAQVSTFLKEGQPLDAIGFGIAAAQALRRAKTEREKGLETALEPLLAAAEPSTARRMKSSKETCAWLTTMPHNLNGTVLSMEEFRDNLRLRYGLKPQHLPQRCDGCQHSFTVEHALQCSRGGLILQRHHNLAGEWHQLYAEALCPHL